MYDLCHWSVVWTPSLYALRIVAADDASDGLESGRGAIRASGSLGAAVRAVSQLKSAMLQQKPQMLLLDYTPYPRFQVSLLRPPRPSAGGLRP